MTRSSTAEAMRRELLENMATLEQIATREGVSRQRISKIVGKLNRGHIRLEMNRNRVSELAEVGLTDAQIAKRLGLSVTYVEDLRQQAGILRDGRFKKVHSRQSIIRDARVWYERYGHTPTSVDWRPGYATKLGRPEQAKRFHEFRAEFGTANSSTVRTIFGAWTEMIRQAGLPRAPQGYTAHGIWNKGR